MSIDIIAKALRQVFPAGANGRPPVAREVKGGEPEIGAPLAKAIPKGRNVALDRARLAVQAALPQRSTEAPKHVNIDRLRRDPVGRAEPGEARQPVMGSFVRCGEEVSPLR